MKRGDKRGQFYLVAAIIISVIVIGFVSMSNYSRRQETTNIQNVGRELSIESEKVLDYATYGGHDEKQTMKNFTERYITYLGADKDSYFLFGNTAQITVVGYAQSDKTIYVNTSSGQITVDLNIGQISSQDFNPPPNNVTLTIDGEDYEFGLKSGENFYFIMFEETGGEKHVIRN